MPITVQIDVDSPNGRRDAGAALALMDRVVISKRLETASERERHRDRRRLPGGVKPGAGGEGRGGDALVAI